MAIFAVMLHNAHFNFIRQREPVFTRAHVMLEIRYDGAYCHITDRVNGERNTIGRVRPVHPFVPTVTLCSEPTDL